MIFNLTAFGEINSTFEVFNFNFEKFNIDLKGKLGLRLELTVKASGKFYAIFFEADYKLEASGQAESYIEPSATLGKDSKGIFLQHKTDFSGIRIVLIIKGQFEKSKTQIKKPFTIIGFTPDITYII
ncbi:hypothetical protein V3Q90_06630 [Flavobacterium oreochromis]|uniref:hypothetical protein n=1 Tax=Flavobacterium oreochromis TaxID=2906078 RepID=UPI001CE59739|nr:hypothetical protein [Flavobacterium oreochromis]QYS87048.1 hypothetical protein JJC03_03500 [Flavobacterium oreochromis]